MPTDKGFNLRVGVGGRDQGFPQRIRKRQCLTDMNRIARQAPEYQHISGKRAAAWPGCPPDAVNSPLWQSAPENQKA